MCELIGTFFEQNKIRLKRIAISDQPILITGETGVGKTLLARFLHNESLRNNKDFGVVNLASLNKSVFESELFGHNNGAFTNALQKRDGLLRAYNYGTVFFDEFGDIPLTMQIKLLHIIENQEITPVGCDKPTKIDVRIITATHQDLQAMIKDGNFRRDFYHRCCVFSFHIPPLRERKSEIPILAQYFMDNFIKELSLKNIPFVYPNCRAFKNFCDTVSKQNLYGNIRELKNHVKQFLIFHEINKPRYTKAELEEMLQQNILSNC
jgi:transcriptional regulator with GAF, ATPase, and Fis domain